MVTSTKLQGVRGDNGWQDVLDGLPVRNDNHRVKMSSPLSLLMQVKNVRFLEETNPCTPVRVHFGMSDHHLRVSGLEGTSSDTRSRRLRERAWIRFFQKI